MRFAPSQNRPMGRAEIAKFAQVCKDCLKSRMEIHNTMQLLWFTKAKEVCSELDHLQGYGLGLNT